MIQNRIKEGAFVKDIAAELNVSAKTVSHLHTAILYKQGFTQLLPASTIPTTHNRSK